MKKNAKREISTEKIYKISKSKERYNIKYCTINFSEIVKPKKSYMIKVIKNGQNKSKNNNNNNYKSIVDKNIKKSVKNNLYSKKKDESSNTHIICGMNTIKKKQLSFTQKRTNKFINKFPNKERKIEKKKSALYNLSKCPDIDFVKEKKYETKEDDMIKTINISGKNKIINENISYFSSLKINNIINKNKNRFVIFPRRFQSKINNKKNLDRKKASSKREKVKEDKSFKGHINCTNSLIHMNYTSENNNNRNKKISKLYKYAKLINTNTNLEINEDIDIFKPKSKFYDNANFREKKIYLNKNINISFADSPNLDTKDLTSEIETIDTPEISNREEEKLLPPIHKKEYFFFEEWKRCHQKLDRNNKNHLSPKQSLYFNIIDLESTDENCYAHKTYISVNYPNNKGNLKDNSFSSYKKNILRFKNLSSEKRYPLSLFLRVFQKNNLFNQANTSTKSVNEEIKNMKFNTRNFELNKKKKINLCYFLLEKAEEDNEVKILIENFLDIKSLIILSSINKKYYINFRHILFEYLYDECLESSNKRNFEMRTINSIFKYSSKNLKNKKNLKNIYNYCKTKSKYESDILKDLTRTFPIDKSFSKESKNYKKLYNILVSYSNYNQNFGYAQGMNFFLAISLFLFDSEEKSFLFLDSLINRFELNNFYGIDTKDKLISILVRYSNILNKYIPDIISYFNKQQISHDFFSTGWILTLFSNSMKKELLITSWTFMIIFGWKFFYSFVIQILIYYKKDIFNINVNNLCIKMKGILKEDKFEKDYNVIIKRTFHFMNNNIIL